MMMELCGKKAVEVSGYLVKCIKTNPYDQIGTIKKVRKETEAFYSLMVGNGYFEIVSTCPVMT
jgi:hypothetical protein